MPHKVQLNQKLALFNFLLQQFGFSKFEDLQRHYNDKELDASTPDNSIFYTNLASQIKFGQQRLKQYDENLIAHLNSINTAKPIHIRLKYYQYFSLLFTEYYLDHFFSDHHDLMDKLNEFLHSSSNPEIKNLPLFAEDDLNKLAYWNATGSGKTFITHINILQYRFYAKQNNVKFRNIILLTPSEDLSAQHLSDLERSGIAANYYWEDKESPIVKVIDIHKIREFSTGEGVTIPLSEFERNNAIFVDEGHKGDSKQDSQWRNIRNTLSEQGFAFEYSATFGQLSDDELLEEYAACIVFDYSYGHFWSDGYGKDYWIHNLTDNSLIAGSKQHQYLLQNLLLFVQQKIYFTRHKEELSPYNIENPLLIFVGTSVEPKATKKQEEENKEVISDVKIVLDFFNDFLKNRKHFISWINHLMKYSSHSLFKEDYFSKLQYLFKEVPYAEAIYEWILKLVFNNPSADTLELYTMRNAEGEIAVRIKNADNYFALIYIGDTSAFKTPLEGLYEFKKDVNSEPLFKSLSDKQSNPINILIGARKFIEGWNNYRVSSIGLINFGKSKGSQIIQLFGRGIRLKGKENSLKRSKNTAGSPQDIQIAETLNIFGLKADYMKQFKDDLEREGIKTLRKPFSFDIKITHDLHQLQLFTLERDNTKPKFETTDVFNLELEKSVKVRLDIASRKYFTQAGQAGVATQVETVNFKLPKEQLDFVDWDEIYTKLSVFKTDRKYHNIHISKSNLQPLLAQIDYRIIADQKITIESLPDIEKLQKLVLQILKQYTELFYKRKLREYDGNNLSSQILTSANANIANIKWEFEIITTDIDGKELQGIQTILQKIEDLADASINYPDKLKNSLLLNSWLDAHIYQPLFKNEDNQDLKIASEPIIDTITPPGLNRGEFEFVEDLRNFISSQQHRYTDFDFYLLRNMSRGTGFGFYFMAGGFYPDFMLWLKHKTSKKQFLTFIDPHGLRNEQNKWDSTKINLHKTIKELQVRLKNPNLVLNSFILQPPPDGLEQAGLHGWHRDDDPQREIPLKGYAASKNVFEIPIEGNESGAGEYVDLMTTRIIYDNADKLKVFCYGSNMSSKRLKQVERCPSATFYRIAKLSKHTLRLHKISKKDGSGKADCFYTGNKSDFVWGVVFEIDWKEKPSLDKEEGKGKGYNEETMEIISDSEEKISAIIYRADTSSINDKLKPYTWYKHHILAGAREFHLPTEYISELEKIEADQDQDKGREQKEMSIYKK